MKLKALYKTLAQPAKKNKPKTLTEINSLELRKIEEPEDKIMHYVDKLESGCWFWKGSKDKYGYGQIRVNRQLFKTHRFAYEVYYGEFDKRLHVCHHCDQPSCINPDHLFLGTAKDNAEDKTAKGRNQTTTKRVSPEQREGIIKGVQEGKSRRCLALEFGVHERTVGRIKAAYEASRHDGIPHGSNAATINAASVLAA